MFKQSVGFTCGDRIVAFEDSKILGCRCMLERVVVKEIDLWLNFVLLSRLCFIILISKISRFHV